MPAEKRRFSGRLFYFNFPCLISLEGMLVRQRWQITQAVENFLRSFRWNHHAISLRTIFGIDVFGINAWFSITLGNSQAVANVKFTQVVASATNTKSNLITDVIGREHLASIIDARKLVPSQTHLSHALVNNYCYAYALAFQNWYSMSKDFYNRLSFVDSKPE